MAVVVVVALVYAQQSAAPIQPPASPQPSTTLTASQPPAATPSSTLEESPSTQPSQTPAASTSASPEPSTPETSESPEPTEVPRDLTREQIRDTVLGYIRVNHNETEPYLPHGSWTGGRVETGGVGSETYAYLCQGWNVTLQNPVVPDAMYAITVTCTPQQSVALVQPTVFWKGALQDGVVTEQNYEFDL